MHLIMYYVFAYIYMYARTQSRKPTQEHEFIDILNPFGIQTQYTVHGRYLILILIHLRADHIPVHIHIPHIRSCVAHHIRTHRIWYECMIVDDEHLGANTPTTKYIHIDVWHINVRRAPWYVDMVDWQQNRMICYCYMLNRLHKFKRCVIAVLRFTSHRSHTTNRYTLQSNSQHIHFWSVSMNASLLHGCRRRRFFEMIYHAAFIHRIPVQRPAGDFVVLQSLLRPTQFVQRRNCYEFWFNFGQVRRTLRLLQHNSRKSVCVCVCVFAIRNGICCRCAAVYLYDAHELIRAKYVLTQQNSIRHKQPHHMCGKRRSSTRYR